MAGNKCVYFNCGLSKRSDPTIKMYRFPVNDAARCQKWIIHSGNVALADLSPKSLKNKQICSKHFDEIFNRSKKLPITALPIHYINDESSESETNNENLDDGMTRMNVIPISKTYSGPSRINLLSHASCRNIDMNSSDDSSNSNNEDENWLRELQNLPSCSTGRGKRKRSLVEENERLRKELTISRKKVNSVTTQLRLAKKKFMKTQLSAKVLYGEGALTGFTKSLVNMQLRHKLKSPWTPTEKKTALSLFYKGPKTYRYLRQKGFTLPAVSTLKSWITNFRCKPGFNKKIFMNITLKVDTMLPHEKKCILMFDEMSIKRSLEYNRKTDIIEGFEDLGEFGRKSSPASQALVLMIRGIYSKWKIPIAYFLSDDGVTYASLMRIITKALEKLIETKLETIGIVCDLSSTNQKVYKHLGVDKEKPYFFLNEKKYYAFFDVPHLFKCVRNNFINNSFVLHGKYICFSDIRKVYDLDKKSTTGKALLKLTDKHLNPNSFEKMNVKLAVQLLSHSVYAAIKTSSRTGELVSSTADNTAHFVLTMDNLFDALNSTRLHTKKPCNRVLSDTNPEVYDAINAGYDLLKNLHKLGKNGKLTRPDSFDGFLVTINAVKQFASDQKNEGFKYLFTGRLIQDPLENQFSVYRQRGGYNRNPTVKAFRSAFKINIVTNLMKPPRSANAGSKPDDDENILVAADENEALTLLNVEEESSSLETDSSSVSSNCSAVHSNGDETLEKHSVVYFAGYLIKKCLNRFKCKDCEVSLEVPKDIGNEEELLIFYKNYDLKYESGLKTPTPLLKNFTMLALKGFDKHIGKHLTNKIILTLKKKIIKNIHKFLPEWYTTNAICCNHREYILNLLLRTQTFKYCKQISSLLKTRQSTKNVKLSIIQHK